MCIYIYVCMYVCVCVCVYVHTHKVESQLSDLNGTEGRSINPKWRKTNEKDKGKYQLNLRKKIQNEKFTNKIVVNIM
jgi:hypothetical protein